MWTMAKDESEDPWVTYAWQYGDVGPAPQRNGIARLDDCG